MTNKDKSLDDILDDFWDRIRSGEELVTTIQAETKAQINNYIKEEMLSLIPEKIDWEWADTPNYNDAIDKFTQAINERFK